MLNFDEQHMRETAQAIRAINPHAAAYSEQALVDNMRAAALKNFPGETCGYVATLGYVLTVWVDEHGKRHVLPSVMSYTVLKYAKGG